MNSVTGTGLFIHLTDQSVFLKNVKNDSARNFIKGSLRFVVAYIALGFFAKIGLYYNLVSGIGKAILESLYKKRTFVRFRKEHLKEAKVHFIKAILDLSIIIFKSFMIVLYAISPEHVINLQKKLEKKLIVQNAIN